MDHDVFISHAHKDKSIADAICEKLESARVNCWLAARDISAAEDWTEATRNAIGSSRVVVLVLSENANAAPHIEREIAHAFYTRRIIVALRLSNTLPRRNFLFCLANVRWFDAFSPPAEQHLEALTASIRDAILPQGAIETTTPSSYSTSGIDPRRDSDNQRLEILKCAAIAASLLTVAWLFVPWLTKRGMSPAGGNVRSVNSSPGASGDSLASAIGDASASKPVDAWMAPSPGPLRSVQQGPQDTPLITPADRSASVTSSPRSDVTPGQRDGLTSVLQSHGRPLPPPGMHQPPHYHHQRYQRSKAQEAQKNADLATSQREALQSHLKDTEAKLHSLQDELKESEARAQMAQKNEDIAASERDALRDQLREAENRALTAEKNKELATSRRGALQKQLEETEAKARAAQNDGDLARSQRDALETQLGEVKERARLAEMAANLAGSQRDAMEADLKKAKEEAQLAHQNADLAVSQRSRSQEEREDAQPAHDEDAVLATNQAESRQMQPPNPGQNAKPAPLTQALDSSVQPARP